MTTTRNRRSWLLLALAACVIAPLSEYVHGYMIEHGVPYPSTPGIPRAVLVLSLVVVLASAAFFVRALLPQTWRMRPVASAVLGGVLLLMLNEVVRVVFIEDAILQSLPYALLDAVPKLALGVEAALVVYAATTRMRWPALLACILLIAFLGAVYVTPWLTAHIGGWAQQHFPNVSTIYNPPYPPFIQFRIAAGFLEPTFAVFVLLALCWRALPGTVLQRVAWFTLFLLLLRNRAMALLVQSFWVKQPFPLNFLAEGQFFLETMTLAILASLAWAWLRPRASVPSAGQRHSEA